MAESDAFHRNYRAQKAALTRALNSREPTRVVRTAGAGLTSFEKYGYPDDWSRWQRALDDAMFAQRHLYGGDRRTRRSGRMRLRSPVTEPLSKNEKLAIGALAVVGGIVVIKVIT